MQDSAKTISEKHNKSAIIGFVLSVIAIFGFRLSGLVGMVFGIVALTQIKHTQEKGKPYAVAAIIIGFIWSVGVGVLRALVEMGY
jgi:hypothetical protein